MATNLSFLQPCVLLWTAQPRSRQCVWRVGVYLNPWGACPVQIPRPYLTSRSAGDPCFYQTFGCFINVLLNIWVSQAGASLPMFGEVLGFMLL